MFANDIQEARSTVGNGMDDGQAVKKVKREWKKNLMGNRTYNSKNFDKDFKKACNGVVGDTEPDGAGG
jgi:hypothetical protein